MACLSVSSTWIYNNPISQYTHLKPGGHSLQSFYLGVLQGGVSGNGAEHFQDLVQSSLERVKLPKNVHLAEVELPLWGSLLQLLLGFMETPLVLLKSTIWHKTKMVTSSCITRWDGRKTLHSFSNQEKDGVFICICMLVYYRNSNEMILNKNSNNMHVIDI